MPDRSFKSEVVVVARRYQPAINPFVHRPTGQGSHSSSSIKNDLRISLP